jgi:hypothetical protein
MQIGGYKFDSKTPVGPSPPLRILLRDPAVYGILASNVLALAVAIWQQWPLTLLLWPYLAQYAASGWYSHRRLLALRRFSTGGLTHYWRPVEPTQDNQRDIANAFAGYYGSTFGAFLVSMLILNMLGAFLLPRSGADWLLVIALSVSFALSERASHRVRLAVDTQGEPNIGALLFMAEARVMAILITLVVGGVPDLIAAQRGQPVPGASTWALMVFTALKTLADASLLVAEQRSLQAAPAGPGRGSG